MVDVVISHGTVVTMDPERRVIQDGHVAIEGDRIVSVGPQSSAPAGAGHVIDAAGHAVIPGFVNAHTHAVHNLMRGGLSDDRALYDWLLNVIIPGLSVYERDDIETAASLFCVEAIRAGITTFVDNVETSPDRWDLLADTSLAIYERFGLRAIYARMFYDYEPPGIADYLAAVELKGPSVRQPYEVFETTDEALARIDALITKHHGRGDGRIQVWPSPGVAVLCSPEGLLGAKALARDHGTMLTLHLAESPFDRLQGGVSSVEFLNAIGFLGPDVLAGHCVQIDANDIRVLAAAGVKVSNNAASNMFLGSGIAPVSEMLTAGITVGIGTDDGNCNNTANMLADLKTVALAQKARYRDATAITAEKVLEMATIDGAAAVGLSDLIGSLEVGKKADVVTVDLSGPHLTPLHSVPSALVYQALGTEVASVLVDGKVLMEHGTLSAMTELEETALFRRAQEASEDLMRRAHLEVSGVWGA